MEEKKSLKQIILDKRKVGEVVVMGIEGPMSTPLEDIVRQPVDGLLYDLNRLEETTLTFIDDPKWVNDFAVALVIRKLKSEIDKLEAENERYAKAIECLPVELIEEELGRYSEGWTGWDDVRVAVWAYAKALRGER